MLSKHKVKMLLYDLVPNNMLQTLMQHYGVMYLIGSVHASVIKGTLSLLYVHGLTLNKNSYSHFKLEGEKKQIISEGKNPSLDDQMAFFPF